MEPLIEVRADTPLRDILEAYPWLPEELIRRSTVADAAKRVGQPVEKLLERFDRMIRDHGA